jgi:TfoX/Sxy family transcriptional regulator of competence genes
MAGEQRFADLVDELLGTPGVTYGAGGSTKGFGSSALKVDNKIFAMLVGGRLAVKLPAARVDALIAAGEGERLDTGRGRLMKEWVTVDPASEWLPLAREALAFLAAKR